MTECSKWSLQTWEPAGTRDVGGGRLNTSKQTTLLSEVKIVLDLHPRNSVRIRKVVDSDSRSEKTSSKKSAVPTTP